MKEGSIAKLMLELVDINSAHGPLGIETVSHSIFLQLLHLYVNVAQKREDICLEA